MIFLVSFMGIGVCFSFPNGQVQADAVNAAYVRAHPLGADLDGATLLNCPSATGEREVHFVEDFIEKLSDHSDVEATRSAQPVAPPARQPPAPPARHPPAPQPPPAPTSQPQSSWFPAVATSPSAAGINVRSSMGDGPERKSICYFNKKTPDILFQRDLL